MSEGKNIGLVQADGSFPNMALMQICQYHEQLGDHVEWWKGPIFNDTEDRIKVFFK
jgi:hypothetical protein